MKRLLPFLILVACGTSPPPPDPEIIETYDPCEWEMPSEGTGSCGLAIVDNGGVTFTGTLAFSDNRCFGFYRWTGYMDETGVIEGYLDNPPVGGPAAITIFEDTSGEVFLEDDDPQNGAPICGDLITWEALP